MDKQEFRARMDRIVKALKDAGYDPYMQLYGYLETGDDSYITRKDNARNEIGELDREMVREFMMTLKRSELLPCSGTGKAKWNWEMK